MPIELREHDELSTERTPLSPAQFFERLLDEHGAAVHGTIRRLCGNSHDADDIFQESAARVWRHLQSQPIVRKPRAWLMAIAYRVFVDSRARQPRHAEYVDSADMRYPPAEQSAEMADEQRRLDRAIGELPETLRGVVVLHYSSGLSLRETAEAMGLSEGTVKSRLNAALTKLRSTLQ